MKTSARNRRERERHKERPWDIKEEGEKKGITPPVCFCGK